MKKFDILLKNRRKIYVFAALAAGVLCAVLVVYIILANIGSLGEFIGTVANVLNPVIIGIVLAYMIDPVAKFFEDKVFRWMKKEGARRTVSAVVALVLVLSLLTVFIGMLVPSLISSIMMLINNADTYYATVERAVERINSFGFGLHIDLSVIETSVKDWLGNMATNLSENLSSILSTTKSIGSVVATVIIGIILAIYILFSKKYMLSGLNRLRKAMFTPKRFEKSTRFWNRCHDIFTQYIGCNIIDAMIVGISNAIFMMILGMPYVPLVSFIVGLTNLIPTFGPVIGGAIGALVLVLVKPSYALWFLMFTIGIQILDAYLIKPRLFSSSIGIAPVWTLIAITVGGNLFGILGVLLAIPVAAILTFIYDEQFIPLLERMSKARAKEEEEEESEADVDQEEVALKEKK